MTAVLEHYRDDPVGFVEHVLGHPPPYDKQREILRTLAVKRRVSVVGANGSGKDWAAARAILWWLATRPRAIAVVTGPTQRQVEQIVWRELRAAYKASRVPLGGRLSGSQWNIADDRYAIGFSTNKADNLQGFHSPELLAVVTEAHAMPQDQMEALKRLYPARILLTGNAFSRDGEFFDSHHTKRHIYAGVTVSVYDTPNFTGENGGAPGMPTEEDVEERKLDWGEDHPLYQGSILARFPDMLDDSLLSRSAIEAAVARWQGDIVPPADGGDDAGHSPRHSSEGWNPAPGVGASLVGAQRTDPPSDRHSSEGWNPDSGGVVPSPSTGEGEDGGDGSPDAGRSPRHSSEGWNPAPGVGASLVGAQRTDPPSVDPSTPLRLGVDVARFGSDKTALCVRRGWTVEYLRSFSRIDTMRTAGEAFTLVRDHDIPAVFVDEGGLGAGVVDRLRELRAPVYGVQFGGKARQSGRFANMRAELFWELRRLFNDNLIAIPPDEELISQLLGLRYDVTSAGQVKMESKSSLRRRGLRSPDKADALAIAFMEPPGLEIWTGPPDAPPPPPPRPVRDSTDLPSAGGSLGNRFGVW